MMKWFGLALMLTVSACGNGPVSPNLCAGWEPIRPTPADMKVMSSELVMQVLSHDQYGQRLCGWSP
jgi:hypothetical protein